MAENINIGNTLEKKNDRELALYSAFSEADDKYVNEMLSDETAARIRAEHRRKALRFRSAIAGCAAVFAIVVGLAVIPHGKMDKSSGSNFAAAKKADEAAPAADAPQYAEAPEQADNGGGENRGSEEAVTTTTAAMEENVEAADNYDEDAKAEDGPSAEKDATFDNVGVGGDNDNKGKDKYNAPDVKEETESLVPMKPVRYDCITLKNGTEWFVGEAIENDSLIGGLISGEDGYEVYELKGFDPGFITAVKNDSGYNAAVTTDLRKDTLAELSGGLGFGEHLFCEKYYGPDGQEDISDEQFRSSVLKLMTERGEAYRLAAGSDLQADTPGSYLCRIGTDDVTFIKDVVINVAGKNVSVICGKTTVVFTEDAQT